MVATEIICESCEKELGVTETTDTPNYCPDCGEHNPWIERDKFDFEDIDFPIVIDLYSMNDNYELWFSLTEEVFGTRVSEAEVANLPDEWVRNLKYCHLTTYFVVERTGETHGPFLEEHEARERAESLK